MSGANMTGAKKALGRKIILLAAFCGLAWGQTTGLTTIQDTLFRADGTRFNGTLTINWVTFDATNIGTIVQQSRTVQVVNGNLQIQLVPNATATPPANIYTVNYQSSGYQQFTENWTVPVSASPLTVSVVRTGNTSSGTWHWYRHQQRDYAPRIGRHRIAGRSRSASFKGRRVRHQRRRRSR